MATLIELTNRQELTKIEIRLMPKEFEDRKIYAFPAVIEFIKGPLREGSPFKGDASLEQQLRGLLKHFITGRELVTGRHFWIMRPSDRDVFELKSADLRMFGWIYRPGIFIATNMATFEEVHTLNNHGSYRDEAVRLRDDLDLDEPKFTTAAEINNVVPF